MTKSKLSQGELVQQSLICSPAPLIDVGVNLVDHSFDKVWAGALIESQTHTQMPTQQVDDNTLTGGP
jgi:hypothetical protein